MSLPVSIGGETRGAKVEGPMPCTEPFDQTFPVSDAILSGGLTACAELSPPCSSGLSDAVGATQLGHLAAQTLALTYSIKAFSPGYGSNTLGQACASPDFDSQKSTLGLDDSSTFQVVLDKANDLIDSSTSGGSPTQAEVTAMTGLIGQCVTKIGGIVSAYPSGRGDSFVWSYSSGGGGGFPLLALLAGLGSVVAVAVAAVIAPWVKASRWRRPNWWLYWR